jgi:hypothetical protein
MSLVLSLEQCPSRRSVSVSLVTSAGVRHSTSEGANRGVKPPMTAPLTSLAKTSRTAFSRPSRRWQMLQVAESNFPQYA